MAQVAVAGVDQVEQPARARDQQVDALPQRLALGLVAHTAVDDRDAVAGRLAHLLGDLFDLSGELAGGGDDERADAARLGRDALQGGQHERRGLAGAGLGAAHDVAAGERERDRIALDGGRLGIAHAGDRL